MSRTVSSLLEDVHPMVATEIVQSQILYPRTECLTLDKAIIEMDYEDDLEGPIEEVKSNMMLQAIDAVTDGIRVLEIINSSRDLVLLGQADFLILYKGGFEVIKLRNANDPQSGRSIYLELNSCRSELIRIKQSERERQLERLGLTTAVGVGLLTVFVFLREMVRR